MILFFLIARILLFLVFFLAVFAALAGLVFSCVHGLRALSLSRRHSGERGLTLRFLALSLCEPLVNSIIISMLLLPAMLLPGSLAIILVTLPMVMLLLPMGGVNFPPPYQHINRHLFRLGLLRWGTAALFFYLGFTGSFLAVAPMLLQVALLWHTIRWGSRQISMLAAPSQPRPARSPSTPQRQPAARQATAPHVRAGMHAARAAWVPAAVPIRGVAPTTQRATTQQQPAVMRASVAPAPATPVPTAAPADTLHLNCPVCHDPAPLEAEDCASCGLIFQSRIPPMLHTLPDYKVLRQLSSGGMSSIFLANKPYSNSLCVIKTLATVESTDPEWRSNAARCLKHEYDMLRQLDHPNIVRVRYWVSGGQSEFMVLEYVPGQNLEQRITHPDEQGSMQPGERLPLVEALRYGNTVADILDYLANQPAPIVHHDIKPSNLILRPDTPGLVLVDFGSAVVLNNGAHQQEHHLDSYGTPGYAAPEQYNSLVSPKSDVYSLGATLYHLLTDDDPTRHPLAFPALTTLPPDVARVLQTALASDPQARPTARQFRAALQRVAAAHG
jgi:hypothetical protein